MSRSKSRDDKRVCWICGKEGHFKKQCYKWLDKNKNQRQGSDRGESSLAKDDAKDLVGLLVAEANSAESDKDEWVLDTGCTFHMMPRADLFIDMKPASGGRVRMANNTITEVKGIGSIRFENPDKTTFVLQDVRYLPGIARNLISMGSLEEKGCEFKAANGILKVIKGCTVFMKGARRRSLYILQAKARETGFNIGESGNASEQKDGQGSDIQLWHSRMGHLGQKGIEVLIKKGCFGDLKKTEMSLCKDCVIGKTHKESFGPALHITKEKLDYIHSDLWGSPNVPPSLSRSQYFLTFTHDYSRKVWTYFLRRKDEVFGCFVDWKKMVETQSERKIKKLRKYNGLEFCNIQFNSLCKEEGIVWHMTCNRTG